MRLWPVRRAARICFYWPADGEVDTRPLLRWARSAGKTCFLPALSPIHIKALRHRLWAVRHDPAHRMHPNRFGIPEPRPLGRGRRPWRALSLLILPLVGFDRDCNRIGMGGGFYDRTLAHLNRDRLWRRPRLIGLAHECQKLDRIDPQPWDVPLDAIVTETAVYQRRRSRPSR